MKRKFIEKLEYWKNNEINTPLLVIGAKQGIRISGRNFGINEKIISIPLYAAHLIK